jgi:phosphoribosyl-ATP pyrophosphohydrolase/phosphoribosyl-AMP cyclohydrolase/histidinol dehydrogenase
MASPILISVDPSSPTSGGLTLKQISYFGRTLIKASSPSQASQFIQQNFTLLDVYVDATDISSPGDIVDILNAGAAKAFVSLEQLTALSREQEVPSSRLVVYVSDKDLDGLKSWISESGERKDVGVCTSAANSKDLAQKLGIDPEAQSVYKSYVGGSVTEQAVKESLGQDVISIVPSDSLTLEREAANKISAARILAAHAVPDENTGLYATSVTDQRGVSLGLVWSSDESIAEALRTGTGVYQSRKRGLWYKGQSSGDVQELVRVGLDCDADCLVFVVKQKGRGWFPSFQPQTAFLLTSFVLRG